jgi:exonuclease III
MSSKQNTDFLSIAAWNINGLSDKIYDHLFLEELKMHDVIFISETHLNNEESIDVEGYHSLHRNHNLIKRNGKKPRLSMVQI